MKKTIIIVAIAVLGIVALCVGVLIAMTPDPPPPLPVDRHTANALPEMLGMERPDTRIERLLAIKTYQGDPDFNDMLTLSQIGGLEYYELDANSDDYLLITPFEINGKLEIYNVVFDAYNEEYVPSKVVFTANKGKSLPENYSLLLRYSRPDVPVYQIKLTQDEQTATYQIINTEDGAAVKTMQFIKDDADGGTESFGTEIKLEEDDE